MSETVSESGLVLPEVAALPSEFRVVHVGGHSTSAKMMDRLKETYEAQPGVTEAEVVTFLDGMENPHYLMDAARESVLSFTSAGGAAVRNAVEKVGWTEVTGITSYGSAERKWQNVSALSPIPLTGGWLNLLGQQGYLGFRGPKRERSIYRHAVKDKVVEFGRHLGPYVGAMWQIGRTASLNMLNNKRAAEIEVAKATKGGVELTPINSGFAALDEFHFYSPETEIARAKRLGLNVLRFVPPFRHETNTLTPEKVVPIMLDFNPQPDHPSYELLTAA